MNIRVSLLPFLKNGTKPSKKKHGRKERDKKIISQYKAKYDINKQIGNFLFAQNYNFVQCMFNFILRKFLVDN